MLRHSKAIPNSRSLCLQTVIHAVDARINLSRLQKANESFRLGARFEQAGILLGDSVGHQARCRHLHRTDPVHVRHTQAVAEFLQYQQPMNSSVYFESAILLVGNGTWPAKDMIELATDSATWKTSHDEQRSELMKGYICRASKYKWRKWGLSILLSCIRRAQVPGVVLFTVGNHALSIRVWAKISWLENVSQSLVCGEVNWLCTEHIGIVTRHSG